MRLRDIPGLAAKLDKVIQQVKGYAEKLRRPEKKRSPYSSAGKKKRKKIKWE